MEPGCIIGVDDDFFTILLGFCWTFSGERFRFAEPILEERDGSVGMGIVSPLFRGSKLTEGRMGCNPIECWGVDSCDDMLTAECISLNE